jgi:hypothetical protein
MIGAGETCAIRAFPWKAARFRGNSLNHIAQALKIKNPNGKTTLKNRQIDFFSKFLLTNPSGHFNMALGKTDTERRWGKHLVIINS